MNQNEIEQAFLETNYIVQLENEVVLKMGEIPTRLIDDLPQIKTWAFITAWNPLPDILTRTQNDIRNNELRKQLEDEGYLIYPGIGISKNEEWSEESFFIGNIESEKANAISSKFGQLAFLYGDRIKGNQLIFTKHE